MSLRATTFASRCAKSLSAAGHGHHTTSTSLSVCASSRSRRHSSSKASCPPGGSSGSERAADTIEKPVEEKRLTGRVSRRRSKDNAATLAAKASDQAFANLPHVPMTDNLAPMGMFNVITTYCQSLMDRRHCLCLLLLTTSTHICISPNTANVHQGALRQNLRDAARAPFGEDQAARCHLHTSRRGQRI